MFFRKTNIFIFCCLFFILGVLILSFFEEILIPFLFIYFCVSNLCLISLAIFWKIKKIRIFCLFTFFLFLGIGRYGFSIPNIDKSDVSYYNGEEIIIEGRVVEEVERYKDKQNIVIEASKLFTFKENKVRGKILINAGFYPVYKYGDTLRVDCKIEAPQEFDGFRYDRFLAKDKIYSVCRYGEIAHIGNTGNIFYKNILKIKNKIREKIDYSLNEPSSSLLKAILLGDKKEIRDNLRDAFSKVGISHIMAISGMHIGIIFGLIMFTSLFVGLWRQQAYIFAVIFLVIYTILIGIPPSAVRATFMFCVVMLALYLGRINSMINSLLLTAVVILFFNPRLLRDDIGFQLSFLAVLGIIYIFPALKYFFSYAKNRKYENVIDIALVSISAQVFTMPLIIYNFSTLSIVSIAANLLILWILPVLITLSIVAIIISFIFSFASKFLFLPIKIIFSYILFVCDNLLKIPGAYFELSINKGYVLVLYILIFLIIIKSKVRK